MISYLVEVELWVMGHEYRTLQSDTKLFSEVGVLPYTLASSLSNYIL